MTASKEQRRLNRKEKRTIQSQARSVEGYFIRVYFDNEAMKQNVIDFAAQLKVAPGEFMKHAVLRTMQAMTEKAEAIQKLRQEQTDGEHVPVPEDGVDEVNEDPERDEFDNPGFEFELDEGDKDD